MTARTSDCDAARLQKLLDGKLPEVAAQEVALHVETCANCRSQMEWFAADDQWWTETKDALSGLAFDQDSFLVGDGEFSLDESITKSVALDFLAPSDNPGMLGRLGEFEILEVIGCGGMGIVLKGYDHELNRYVAVKVLHPFCATSAAARRRFVREAQAAAAIVHQHVVAIHAVDASHHPPYLVMPFIPGESLQQRLSRLGPLELVDGLRIGHQVAEGLAAAHAHGIVHRDIKPGNILLERNVERVLLTDFGLARAADDASLTRSGVIAGTPQYMSPEQARGDQVDHRTDLFSLGTVLYTILVGHSPFRAESAMAVLRRVCDDTPRPVRELNPSIPVWLEAFIAKLHAKQPGQRYANASDVADLLQRALAHVQQPTHVGLPPELASLVPPEPKPVPSRIGLRFAFAIVAGIATVSLLMFWQFSTREKPATAIPPDKSSAPLINDREPWNDSTGDEVQQIHRSLSPLEREGDF